MERTGGKASAASRDALLTLRRVERQQHLIERLHAAPGRVTFDRLAAELGVSRRTIARDLERLRGSGIPIEVVPGRNGGAGLERGRPPAPIPLDLPEIAALLASLAALGPTVSESASSATHKLTAALVVGERPGAGG